MVSEHRDLRRALGRECIAELLREVVPVPVPVPVSGRGNGNGHWPEFSASATRPEEEASRLLRARETVRGLGPGLLLLSAALGRARGEELPLDELEQARHDGAFAVRGESPDEDPGERGRFAEPSSCVAFGAMKLGGLDGGVGGSAHVPPPALPSGEGAISSGEEAAEAAKKESQAWPGECW